MSVLIIPNGAVLVGDVVLTTGTFTLTGTYDFSGATVHGIGGWVSTATSALEMGTFEIIFRGGASGLQDNGHGYIGVSGEGMNFNGNILNLNDGSGGGGGTLNIDGGVLIGIGTNTPGTSGAFGQVGSITWDSSYLYVCVAANTWKRSAITTW